MIQSTKLSNIQKLLLTLYARDIDENDLTAVKNMLAEYFAQKASDQTDAFLSQSGNPKAVTDKWENEHLRTPYNPVIS